VRALRRRYRELTVFACALLGVAAAVLARGPVSADGVVFDLLVAARAAAFPARDDPARSPVAVVAVDERSLDDDLLRPYPRALLAPVWAELLDGLARAGARGVGFDIIFAYSASELAGVVPAMAAFDAPFLAALAAHRDRVVLGRSQTAIPTMPMLAALRDEQALGLVELFTDPDGRYRRVPAWRVAEDGTRVPTLAGGLLRIAHAPAPADGVLLAPRRHMEAMATYGIADVLRCARAAPEAVAAAFRDRLVLVGTTHRDEDRKVSSGRFLAPPRDGVKVHPCGLERLPATIPGSPTVPGVFLHAEAVAEVLTGHVTTTAPRAAVSVLTAATGAAGAAVAAFGAPWIAALATLGLAIALAAGATSLLARDLWVPLALPLAALVAAPVLAYVIRYIVEERGRRRLQNAFGHYVAPALVDQLLDDAAALRLGGDRREVTVMFADLSGFTALSTRVDPETLTATINEYLAYIVDQVDATGGYVDKFIGDAVMAVWGAPVADPRHAVHAVQAAMAATERIVREHERARAAGKVGFSVKIGLNSGPAVIGNVGTERRFNYTAIGETVNVASRLESVPTLYDCHIVAGEHTAALAGDDVLFTELDTIKVKGREAPLRVFTPRCPRAQATAADLDAVARYAAGLRMYRNGDFDEASRLWDAFATERADRPARRMAERARTLAIMPPDGRWDGVWELVNK
jgi:class 3 adenylate cyclase/CHASE2 domain-containing sensor protein